MRNNQGCFVSFEGIDGAGKSAVARSVCDRLSARGTAASFVDKATLTSASQYANHHLRQIRSVLWDYDPSAPLGVLGDRHWLYLLASWFHAVEACIIEPLLAQGSLVIADGWYLKYLARFTAKPGSLAQESRTCFGSICSPDIVIFLDTDPAVAACRKQSLKPSETGALDGLEGDPRATFIDYQLKVRANLLSSADAGWHLIDTTDANMEEVADRAVRIISASAERSTALTA